MNILNNNLLNSLVELKENLKWGDIPDCKKYKELLDSGIITQEEFDIKKKQILGL